MAKRLVCPACGDVIGDAVYRRWPGSLTITALAGYEISPTAAGIMRRIVERETGADGPARVEYVTGHITDPIYDLRCGRGHSTLRTAPGIIRAMTAARGEWAALDVDD